MSYAARSRPKAGFVSYQKSFFTHGIIFNLICLKPTLCKKQIIGAFQTFNFEEKFKEFEKPVTGFDL